MAVESKDEVRRLATIMFTDMVGYSALVQKNEALALELLDEQRAILRGAFAEHGGREIEAVGDGFFVEFPSALSAARCAVAIQRALERHRRTHGFSPEVRIGIHAAQATRVGGDFQGMGVHVAARIGALASGGEILASRDTVGHLHELVVSQPRAVSLKGVAEQVKVVSIGWR